MFVKREKVPPPQLFYVLNELGEVYSGMLRGKFKYSSNWEEGKPVHLEGTRYLRRENSKIELVKEEEFL